MTQLFTDCVEMSLLVDSSVVCERFSKVKTTKIALTFAFFRREGFVLKLLKNLKSNVYSICFANACNF